jgi:hypothetical protein
MKLDKTFSLPGVKGVTVNAYVWAINVTDARNVEDIYPSTGEVDNDGYLDTLAGQQWLATNGQNAEAIYKLALDDPTRYGPPRQIRLGLRFDWY